MDAPGAVQMASRPVATGAAPGPRGIPRPCGFIPGTPPRFLWGISQRRKFPEALAAAHLAGTACGSGTTS